MLTMQASPPTSFTVQGDEDGEIPISVPVKTYAGTTSIETGRIEMPCDQDACGSLHHVSRSSHERQTRYLTNSYHA